MSNVSWVRSGGPLAPFADGYGAELARLGFTHHSVVTHVVLMGQLSRWMSDAGIVVGGPDRGPGPGFLRCSAGPAGRTGCRRRGRWSRCSGTCGAAVVVPPPPGAVPAPLEDLLSRYRRYLLEGRGLAPSTVVSYEGTARLFLSERTLAGGGETGVEGLCGADVTGFLLRECSRLAVGSAKNRVNHLRSLLRFLQLGGLIAADLASAVPPVAGWRDTSLPATLAAAMSPRCCRAANGHGRPGCGTSPS